MTREQNSIKNELMRWLLFTRTHFLVCMFKKLKLSKRELKKSKKKRNLIILISRIKISENYIRNLFKYIFAKETR